MSYDVFSQYYDALTDNVGYRKRADYFCSLLSLCGVEGGILLDLACGTGNMSVLLAQRGFDVIGVDVSVGMLSAAQQKSMEQGLNILYLCQDMRHLDLYGTIDAAVCVLDGLNHLPDANSVKEAIKGVSLFMNSGGAFAFDVNTVYKHRQVLANNAFIYDCEDVFCAWQNTLNKENCRVDISLDFFEDNGDGTYERSGESFSELAYPLEDISEMLTQAGFEVIGIYDDMTFSPVKENSERAVFLAKKK